MPNGTDGVFFDDFLDEISSTTEELSRIEDLANGVAKTITDAFRGVILEGRTLNSLLSEIGRSFADIALKAALKPVGTLISGGIEHLFQATNPALQITPFAKGGVINAPSYFPMSTGGLGLAGEAGAEAIMPLSRSSDGRLGVAAAAPSAPISINFTVHAKDAASFRQSEAELSALLLRAVRRGMRAN